MVRKTPDRDMLETPESDPRSPATGGASQSSAYYGNVAIVLAATSCVLYSLNGELLQALQLSTPAGEGHASPLANLTLCHLGGLMFLPYFLCTSSSSSHYGKANLGNHVPGIALSSLLFAVLLMGYNYAWLQSAKLLPTSLTNAIFQTSVALVCAVSTALFNEPLTRMRVMGVMLALCGSALASGCDAPAYVRSVFGHHLAPPSKAITSRPNALLNEQAASVGILLALCAAVGVTLYQVLFRYWYSGLKNDVRFLAYFGAWVSGWHVALFPLVILASWAGIEKFELPHGQHAWAGTIVSAAVASTVNALYLCIVMWGSPMLLPCASALSVPLTVMLDMFFHSLKLGFVEVAGHFLVVASVFMIMQGQPTSSLKTDKRWSYAGKDHSENVP